MIDTPGPAASDFEVLAPALLDLPPRRWIRSPALLSIVVGVTLTLALVFAATPYRGSGARWAATGCPAGWWICARPIPMCARC